MPQDPATADEASPHDRTTPLSSSGALPPAQTPVPDADSPAESAPTPAADPLPAAPTGRSRWRRPTVLAPAGLLLALGLVYAVDLIAAGSDVPRHTVVAGVPIGGLSPAAAADVLTERLAPQVQAERTLTAADVTSTLSTVAAGITLDVAATVDAADDQPLSPWSRLVSLFSDRKVAPVLTEDETALAAQVDQLAETVDQAPVDATIQVTGTTAATLAPMQGRTLDRDGAVAAIEDALATGDPDTPIELPVDVAPVRVDAAEAERVLTATVGPALAAPVTLTGADSSVVEVPATALAAALTFTPADDGTLEVGLDPATLAGELGDELGVFGEPARDARFEVSPDGASIAVVPSLDGTGVDPAALAAALLPVLPEPAPRQVEAALGPVPAAFTTEQAQALGITSQVSSFSTDFTSSASGTNIRVVAEEVDGAIVRPGETFSLNGFTGPRGVEQGYVDAGVINNGEFTTAVGGGISQFATTMFNAVFFAGLEDVFHKPHSYYISRYPAGREATVYYDSIDLQWRNDSDTGIYVQASWVPGTITVTFWGTPRYTVTSESSGRYNTRTPAVQEKVDDGSCRTQAGASGFDIVVTRVFADLSTGAELRREDFTTRYAAEPVIRCVPPPPASPTPGAPPASSTAPSSPAGRRPVRGAAR